MGRKVVKWLLLLAGAAFPAYSGAEYLRARLSDDQEMHIDCSGGMRPVRGTLLISAYGDHETDLEPLNHQTLYVNGPDYAGMEDNDLRGFLDGVFKYGWNQPTQVHVRVGRRARRPCFGELELFRVLQRWDDIALPPGARVTGARLHMSVEATPPFPVDIAIYKVNKDFNPGNGGVRADNVSPPRKGEVWWCDVGYQQEAWGLPGAGFASDVHRDADTGAMPLAMCRCRPGDVNVVFSSDALTRYLGEQVAAGKPVLLLVKLLDDYEDSPGSLTMLYSGSHGDERNVVRRPHLFIEWENLREVRHLQKEVLLEHGRVYDQELTGLDGTTMLAVSFRPESGGESPTIEVCDHPGRRWRSALFPVPVDSAAVTVRVSACTNRVILGNLFESLIRDTWVLREPPGEHEVLWTFLSPSGRRHVVRALYHGQFQWVARIKPDELGRWRYWWTQNFAEKPYTSALGAFDVMPGDQQSIRAQLLALRDQLGQIDPQNEEGPVEALRLHFVRLERAVMQGQTPEEYQSPSGRELRALLRDSRALLSGRQVPDAIPLRARPLDY